MAVGSALFEKTGGGVAKADAIPPSELWTKLAQSERPTKEVPFPRKGADGNPIGHVLMRPLTQGELIVAQAEAEVYAKSLVKDHPDLVASIKHSPIFENACACEIIFRATRRVDNPKLPVFPTAASVRDHNVGLTNDECAVLMNDYELVQLQLGPIAAYMSEDAREALIKRLQEGGSALPLASLSWAQLTELTMHLVSQLASLQTASSSVGMPQDSLISNSSE